MTDESTLPLPAFGQSLMRDLIALEYDRIKRFAQEAFVRGESFDLALLESNALTTMVIAAMLAQRIGLYGLPGDETWDSLVKKLKAGAILADSIVREPSGPPN